MIESCQNLTNIINSRIEDTMKSMKQEDCSRWINYRMNYGYWPMEAMIKSVKNWRNDHE